MWHELYFLLFLYVNVLTKSLSPVDLQGEPLFLTPYLERGEIETAKCLSLVNSTQFAGVNSHAAYFTVNKTNKWHLFFWYFPVQGSPLETTPLIIWLQGGPGCSSLYGVFEEIGPIQIKDGKVERMSITWGSNYSLLFIDNPVGTGFSFTEEPNQYVTNEDMVGSALLNFIQQFFQVFIEVKESPLFIAGESYAGKFIPAFGHYIYQNKNKSSTINLKGLAIGNGWTDPPTLFHYSEWALQVGLIDHAQAHQIHELEEEARKYWAERNISAFEEKANDAYHLLIHYAPVYIYNYIKDSPKPSEFVSFMNNKEIQQLLHVKNMDYIDCNFDVYHHLRYDIYDTVKPWLEELLEHYGVMCYRFVKASGNFMEVMVRSAGHMVPFDQPRAAKQIIDMFIQKFK